MMELVLSSRLNYFHIVAERCKSPDLQRFMFLGVSKETQRKHKKTPRWCPNRELSVFLWDEKRKRGKGHSKYVISLNKYLDQVFTGLHEAHRQLLQEDIDISSKAVKARFLKEDDRGKTLLDLISYHNSTMSTTLRPGTMKNYYSSERCIKKFLNDELGIEYILLKKLNYGFIVPYEQYVRKYKPSTRMNCTNCPI